MIRFLSFGFAALTCAALCFSCASTPSVNPTGSLVRYGAGSIDEDRKPAPQADKAAAPGMAQRVKTEDVLAQAKIHEADLDVALAAQNFPAALSAYDSIADLLSGIPSAAQKLAAVRGKVESALDTIVLEPVSVPGETSAGTAFKKDFSVKAYSVAQDKKIPLPGLEFSVLYPALAADGSKVVMSESRKSDADGLVAFSAPVPARSGKDKVVIAPALTTRDSALLDSINARKSAGTYAVSFPHVVSTNAKRQSTTIAILDFDKNGKAITSSDPSATTLLAPLVRKGFNRIGMAEFPTQLASGDESAVLKSAKAQFGSGVQRFIFGTAKIESLAQGDDGAWTCTLVTRVSVWDFALDAKVYSTEIRYSSVAKTESAAIEAARKKVAGELLPEDLVYNM
jgi:hypothetical protein